MAARRLKRRLVYREHDDEEVRNAIRAAIPESGVIWDYLTLIGMDMVDGANEYERGIVEGKRRFAGELLTLAMTKDLPKVRTNQEEDDAA